VANDLVELPPIVRSPSTPHPRTEDSARVRTGSAPDPRRWRILAVLCLVEFMLLLDDTVINIALPAIQHDLGFSEANLAWVVNAYVLVFGGFLLLGGRCADLFGRRRMFLAGATLFGIASLTNGLATDQAMLIASRAAQGLGAALVSPAALALIAALFRDPGERTRALGIWGGLTAAGGTTGVLLSGLITDTISWRWIFFINLPVVLVAVTVLPRLVGKDARPRRRVGFDLPGAALVTAGLTVLVYSLLLAPQHGWSAPRTLGGLGLALALLVAFGFVEARAPRPLVRLGFFRNRSVATADALQLVLSAALFGVFFLLTLYLQQVLGYSPLRSGVAYLGFFAGIFVGFGSASQLIPRVGVRPLLVGGLLLTAGGLLWFSHLPVQAAYWSDIFPGMIILAVGLGWSFLTITTAAMTGVDEDELGLASGVLNAGAQIGGALGLSVLVAIATTRGAHLLAAGAVPLVAQVHGSRLAFAVGAAICTVGAAGAALFIGRLKPAELPGPALPRVEEEV